MGNFFQLKQLKDIKFSILLIYELFFIFIYPLVQTTFFEWVLHLITVLVLILIKQLTFKTNFLKMTNIILLIFIIILFSVDYTLFFTDTALPISLQWFSFVYDAFFIIYLFYTSAILLIDLLNEKEPMTDTLSGAASIFLLIGFSWAYVYIFMYDIVPSAFQVIEQQEINNFFNFLLFSLSRLVSLDNDTTIVPLSSMARALSLLETVMASLYLAIITGEIVGIHLENRNLKYSKNIPEPVEQE